MLVVLSSYWGKSAIGYARPEIIALLPPSDDTPEEILRTEIITEARSPIDGKRLTASEYAELQTQLQTSPPPKLDTRIRDQIFLLRLRKALLQLFPFLDI
ncbi:glutathione S-transferase [Anabaena cylindrica UHCC 0172]|nr:glutathione S-transferase [Anabaena cylindrica]MEA5551443.1 glutathione S-transferase [Anabaena cylindrica UHCC 0172]